MDKLHQQVAQIRDLIAAHHTLEDAVALVAGNNADMEMWRWRVEVYAAQPKKRKPARQTRAFAGTRRWSASQVLARGRATVELVERVNRPQEPEARFVNGELRVWREKDTPNPAYNQKAARLCHQAGR